MPKTPNNFIEQVYSFPEMHDDIFRYTFRWKTKDKRGLRIVPVGELIISCEKNKIVLDEFQVNDLKNKYEELKTKNVKNS